MSKSTFQYCFELPLPGEQHALAAKVMNVVYDPRTDWKPLTVEPEAEDHPLRVWASKVFPHATGESDEVLYLAVKLYLANEYIAVLLVDADIAKHMPLLHAKQDGSLLSLLVHTKWPGDSLGPPLHIGLIISPP